MTRYFFEIEFNGKVRVDEDGTELVSAQEAKREAVLAIAAMAAENIPHDGPLNLSINVMDGSRRTLFLTTVTFDFRDAS